MDILVGIMALTVPRRRGGFRLVGFQLEPGCISGMLPCKPAPVLRQGEAVQMGIR